MTLLVRHVSSFLLPASMVIALAILVKGYTQVGDGFAAGVVAALGVVVQYVGHGREDARAKLSAWLGMKGLLVGLALMLFVVFAPTLRGQSLVTHFPAPEASLTSVGSIDLHTAALFDVGVFLVVLNALVLVLDHLIELREDAS